MIVVPTCCCSVFVIIYNVYIKFLKENVGKEERKPLDKNTPLVNLLRKVVFILASPPNIKHWVRSKVMHIGNYDISTNKLQKNPESFDISTNSSTKLQHLQLLESLS